MEMSKMKKMNNSGMSLVELIVVVLILGIVSAAGVAGVASINRMDATAVAEDLNSLVLRARTQAITYDDSTTNTRTVLRLNKQGKNYVGTLIRDEDGTEVVLDEVELSASTVSIHFISSSEDVNLATDTFDLKFNKSNGSFDYADDSMKFVVSGSKTKNVILVKATGRAYIE